MELKRNNIMPDLFDKNYAIIEAYEAVKKSALAGWVNTGPVAHIGGHTVDLVRNWKPDNSVEFHAVVYKGDKRITEHPLFSGKHEDTTWNEMESKARDFLVNYTTGIGIKS